MKFPDIIKEIFFPKRCAFCGGKSEDSFTVCAKCLETLPRSYGKPIFPVAFKKNSRIYLKCVMAPFFYSSNIKSAVRALKFKGRKSAAAPLAVFMSDIVISSYYYQDIDFILSVPISKKRFKKRTYNQSELLAKELAGLANVPYEGNAVIRHGHRPPQASMTSRTKRLENVKGVFTVVNPDIIAGKRLLLVDDVITTGSTINECAKALVKAGAKEVLGITAAQACK